MPLTFDVTKIKDYATKYPDRVSIENGKEERQWNPTTDTLIWLLMFVGITEITDKNYQEVASRIRTYEQVFGALRTSDGKDILVELADVKGHIGLHTNVSTKSKTKFLHDLVKRVYEEAEMEIWGEQKKLDEGAAAAN